MKSDKSRLESMAELKVLTIATSKLWVQVTLLIKIKKNPHKSLLQSVRQENLYPKLFIFFQTHKTIGPVWILATQLPCNQFAYKSNCIGTYLHVIARVQEQSNRDFPLTKVSLILTHEPSFSLN